MSKPSSLSGTIVRTFQIDATPERAYEAFTNKKDLEMWKADNYEIDPRKGGKYKMGRETDGYAVMGEFIELVPNSKIVYTWKMNDYEEKTGKPIYLWPDDSPSKVTVKFEKAKNGTRITLVHEGFPERDEQYYNHEVGWDLLVGQVLKHYLEDSPAAFGRWWAEQEPKWDENWQKMVEERMRKVEVKVRGK